METLGATNDIGDDSQRLEQLYREAGPNLLAYLQRQHRDSHLAEDLLQETFAAALSRPDRLWSAASPRAYLFGIARNLCVDAYRHGQSSDSMQNTLESAPAAAPDPRIDLMHEAIAKLNSSSREVLELRLQSELSYEEIAAILQIPVGTVRSRLHHAVKNLRQTLTRNPERLE